MGKLDDAKEILKVIGEYSKALDSMKLEIKDDDAAKYLIKYYVP